MLTSLLSIVIPVIVGLIIRRVKPRFAEIIGRILRPFSGIFIVFIVTFGVYANLYAYKLLGMVYYLIPATILLPSCGFLLGLLLSWLLRRDGTRMITIALETGIQNSSIAIVLVLATFPPPDNDLAAIMPISVAIFTPFVMAFIYGVNLIRQKFRKDKEYELGVDSEEFVDRNKDANIENTNNGNMGSVYTIDENKQGANGLSR